MKKLRLLLLDANVVIGPFSLGLWDRVAADCEVFVAETVVSEAKYYEAKDGSGAQRAIDLARRVRADQIQMVKIGTPGLDAFLAQFDPVYLEKLDPGETESLAHLLAQKDVWVLCSADAIVFRVLAHVRREDQGLSLEEVLQKIGLTKKLAYRFTAEFRDRYTRQGKQEMIRGIGRKDKGWGSTP